MHHIINAQKGLTIFWCTLLLIIFKPTLSIYGFVYMGLHGAYGLIWLIKDYTVPDFRFRQPVGPVSAAGSNSE